MSHHRGLSIAAAVCFIPGLVRAATLGPGAIFANAAPVQKLIIVSLVGASLVGVAISVIKLTRRARLAGGSAFVSGLRLGGPITGLLGGAYAAMSMSFGIANITYAPTLRVLAPGLAEAAAMVALGLLCGATAMVLNWLIQSRIERQPHSS